MAKETETTMWTKTYKPRELNKFLDVFGNPIEEVTSPSLGENREEAHTMELLVLYGGQKVGMMTNPDRADRPNFVQTNGEKIVCLAQGGECRQYGEFYTPGMNDAGSWKTPIISHKCEDRCPYKYLVCDGHDHAPEEDVDIFIPFLQYNKFRGQYKTYCKDFDRIHGSKEESEDSTPDIPIIVGSDSKKNNGQNEIFINNPLLSTH